MGSNGVICGPPNYNCAVTDNQTHLPTTTVTLGNGWSGHSGGGVGANIVAIDHSLVLPGTSGAKILRLSDSTNVASYARTLSSGGPHVISGANANGKRYAAFLQSGGAACLFEFDEAALANAVEGQVCANCSRKLWCEASGSASYGGTANESYAATSLRFPRSANAPTYSFYAVHQGSAGTSPKLRRYLIVVKGGANDGQPPDASGTQTLAYKIDPAFPEYDPDNANCLNGTLAAGGYTYGNLSLTSDDRRLVMQTNPQDISPWAVAIRVDTSPPQCRFLNSQTMQVSCGWDTPSCWKNLTYNADAQARFQRTIASATRDATGNVTVSFTTTHTFPVGNGATANVEGCGTAANIDVRGAPITAVTGSTLTYTSTLTNQGNTFNGLNCTFSFGRGMHNSGLERSGEFEGVGYNITGLAGAYLQDWDINTDDFTACPAGQDCSGHQAAGYARIYMPQFASTRKAGYRAQGNPVSNLTVCTDMGLNPPIQEHFSANTANQTTNMWLESTFNAPASMPHGPYEGEILVHNCADGKIRRFTHNFSNGAPNSGSLFASAVTQVSADGNYALSSTKFQAFWDQFAEATLSGLTLTVDGTAKTITRSSGDFGVDGIVVGDLVKLSGMVNAANNYGFEVTAVNGAVLTVRDPTNQLLSEGPTASTTVERHASMAARGFGDKAGNNTCDPTQDPDASGTEWCRSDVLLVKLM
jgi:hypothetical protein